MLMKKVVIVINGSGGVGKDTLCHMAEKEYRVKNISSITPIKELAATCGWKGEKTDRARRFLSDLKLLTVRYNDFPTNWVIGEYEKFLRSDEEIMFVHIREGAEIRKFVERTKGRAVTLLIRGGERFAMRRRHGYGNRSDDEVERYHYDYYFVNDKPLHETPPAFLAFMEKILSERGEEIKEI